jgi:hypothetical protein
MSGDFESLAPWEKDAERYGRDAARLLLHIPEDRQAEARAVLERAVAQGEPEGEIYGQLHDFYRAELEWDNRIASRPRRPQPRRYKKTARREVWGQAIVALIDSGHWTWTQGWKLGKKAMQEARDGIKCTVPELAQLPPDGGTGPVSEYMIKRLIQGTRTQRATR